MNKKIQFRNYNRLTEGKREDGDAPLCVTAGSQ
jgi:hypothetical protein